MTTCRLAIPTKTGNLCFSKVAAVSAATFFIEDSPGQKKGTPLIGVPFAFCDYAILEVVEELEVYLSRNFLASAFGMHVMLQICNSDGKFGGVVPEFP